MKVRHNSTVLESERHEASLGLFAANTLRAAVQAMLHESPGVRQGDDPECLHRLRVAARRLRSLLPLFAEHLPRRKSQQWRQHLRDLMRALSPARDADVQSAFVQQFLTTCCDDTWRPGIERVLLRLQQQRQAAQSAVIAALEQMESDGWAVEMDTILTQIAAEAQAAGAVVPSHALYRDARQAIQSRLDKLRTYEAETPLPEQAEGLHAMRIATKRLRYPLQAFASLYADTLNEAIHTVRTLQDLLGDVRDCALWSSNLTTLIEAERARTHEYFGTDEPLTALLPGMLALQQERQQYGAQRHEQLVVFWRNLQENEVWTTLQHALDTPLALDSAQTRQAVFDLAQECQYEAEHAQHVTELALKLFDELQPLHALGSNARCWLEYAALLHDIGWIEGRKRHHKVALRRIVESPLLPFAHRERLLLGSIVRYHRRALPSPSHEHFAALEPEDQQMVRVLAGILRVADGLDRTHRTLIQDLSCDTTTEHIIIRCTSTAESEAEQQSAMAKGRLLEKTFQRTLVITW